MSSEKPDTLIPPNYPEFVENLKKRIQAAQVKAALAVNNELVLLYWDIGRDILTRQLEQSWGSRVIDKLSEDLKIAFPGVKGFSSRNLNYMRLLAESWPDKRFVQQAVAQIPWGHNILILQKTKSFEERSWYIVQTIEHGWSRAVLEHKMDAELYKRQVTAEKTTNFEITLPAPESDLAHQLIKEPYCFDFLTLAEDHKEKELQQGLMNYMKDLLLELGAGFAFVGDNYHLEIGGEDYYIDLLFYHYKLRSFIVVELKARKFDPRDVGQLNFYLSAVDDLLRQPEDKPTVGLLLCKDKNHVTAEYALSGITKPMGVSEYTTAVLPEELKGKLPTIEEIEQRLNIPEIRGDVES